MNWDLLIQVAVPLLTLVVGALINHLLERRERLIAHLGHISSFRLQPRTPGSDPVTINLHSVVLRNTGRKVANNVRLGHNFLPEFNVYPDTEHTVRALPGGGKEIVFPKLVPRKEVTVAYLYYPPDTWNQINTHIESDDGPAKVVPALLQVLPPRWAYWLAGLLMLSGAIGIVYVAAQLAIQWAT